MTVATEPSTRMKVLTIGSKKGGVGKTTLTHNLAAAAGANGWRVLLVDTDSQSPSSSAFKVDLRAGRTLAELLTGKMTETADAIVRDIAENVDLLAADPDDLERARKDLSIAGARSNKALRRILAKVADDYDLVIIDTPPELGGLQEIAVIASDYALAVSRPTNLDLPAALQFVEQVRELKDLGETRADVLGLVWNFYLPRAAETGLLQVALAMADPSLPVMASKIPDSRHASSATLYGAPAVVHFPGGAAALRFRDLAREVLTHIIAGTKPLSAFDQYGVAESATEAKGA